MKVAFITSGYFPVPATKGGAVEAIVENIIKQNEEFNEIKLEIFSCYDEKAKKESLKYKNTKINFVKILSIVKLIDRIIFFIAKNILKKEKTMSYRYIMQRLYFLNRVSKDLKRNNYDRIILENHATLFLALKWRKNYKKYDGKYYYHVHNEISSNYGCAEIIRKSKKILCVSNYIKKHIEEHFNLNGNTVEVLKNCIDTNKFNGIISEENKKALKKKYNLSEDEKIILFTGRISKEKGIKELLHSIINIKEKNFKLLIVGSFFFGTEIKNDFEKEIETLVNEVKEKVSFTGYISYSEIQEIYAIADIAVLPSIWNDPAPLTIIESMSSGLPIITTDSGGIPEYAKDGCAIIIKRDKNLVNNLSNEIEKLIKDEEKMKNMSKISKENVKELNLKNFYYNFLREIN